MPVYVDRSRYPYRGRLMCHMLADTLEELHAMAELIGHERERFQPVSTPHYDLDEPLRARAVALGAVEIDRRRVGQIIRAWREQGYTRKGLTKDSGL